MFRLFVGGLMLAAAVPDARAGELDREAKAAKPAAVAVSAAPAVATELDAESPTPAHRWRGYRGGYNAGFRTGYYGGGWGGGGWGGYSPYRSSYYVGGFYGPAYGSYYGGGFGYGYRTSYYGGGFGYGGYRQGCW